MSKQKTEKQIRVRELTDKILAIQTEEHEEPLYDRKYSICNINGEKWIKASGLHYNMSNYLKKMKANGLISNNQILHARMLTKVMGAGRGRLRWQISTLMKLSAILACKDELLGKGYLFHLTRPTDYDVRAVIDDAERAEVKTNNFATVGQMEENERMFAERCRLITENNHEQRQRERREANGEAIEDVADEEPTGCDAEQPGDNEQDFDFVKFAVAVVDIVEDNRRLRDEVARLTRIDEINTKLIANYKKIDELHEDIIKRLKDSNLKLRLQVEALQQAIKEKEDAE